MPRKCSICVHPDRESIDKAILAGDSLRDIARQFRVSKDAVSRHGEKHLPHELATARQAEKSTRVDNLWDRITGLVAEAEELLAHGKETQDAKAWAGGIREARQCLELLAKVRGELNEQPTVNVLFASPEFALMSQRLCEVLKPHPELRAQVAEVLSERAA